MSNNNEPIMRQVVERAIASLDSALIPPDNKYGIYHRIISALAENMEKQLGEKYKVTDGRNSDTEALKRIKVIYKATATTFQVRVYVRLKKAEEWKDSYRQKFQLKLVELDNTDFNLELTAHEIVTNIQNANYKEDVLKANNLDKYKTELLTKLKDLIAQVEAEEILTDRFSRTNEITIDVRAYNQSVLSKRAIKESESDD